MSEIVEMKPAAQQLAVSATPSDLLRIAVEQGADMEKLERLMALQERWEANQARKAYVQAMAEFKKTPPEIFKRKNVSFGETSYNHATLGDVTTAIVHGLAQYGISHRWDTKQEGGRVIVTCILTHNMGHSESTTLEAAPDSSGKKNGIQQVASTVTYLQRYTLLAASGLATKDMDDDDGRAAETSTELRDDWVGRAEATKTESDLQAVWDVGVKSIEKANDLIAYAAFKAAVTAKRKSLKKLDPESAAFVADMDKAEAAQ